MTIGERIKKRRTALGISQVALADKVGISKQSLYKYENGIITNIPSDKIEEIASVLNTTPAYIMGWDDEAISAEDSYYLNDEARDMAEFLFKNPEYKVLFDASRKVKPEDIDFLKRMMDRMRGSDSGD